MLRRLLPIAHEGLEAWGVAAAVRDRYLGIIEGRGEDRSQRRLVAGRRPSSGFEERGADRRTALRQMLELYCDGMHANEPVHTWELP